MYVRKNARDVLEEDNIYEGNRRESDMKEFGTLDSSEKTIAI